MSPSNRDFVNSLARGLEVIRAFSRARPRMTLSEISQATNMTRATVRRFLLTLVRDGYADSDGKYFSLAPKILELGYAALSSMTFLDDIQPILVELAKTVRESCFAAVLEDHDVVYVASAAPPSRIVNISVSVGSRAPAHSVSTGRVLVAALPDAERKAWIESAELSKLTPNTVTSRKELQKLINETSRQGFSIVDQELEVGLRSIAVPIRDNDGNVLAALNVACPSTRISPEDMRDGILKKMLVASEEITRRLKLARPTASN
jgi:IclR family pca regulon transcriptional regulator